MDFEVERRGSKDDWTWVGVRGEVDLHTAGPLKSFLDEVVDDGSKAVVVDLTEVDFLDSSGLGSLVGALKHMRERSGHLALVCPEGRVTKIMRITGLDSVFKIYPAADEVPTGPPAEPEVDDG